MNSCAGFAICLAAAGALFGTAQAAPGRSLGQVQPLELRCEYRANPCGLDAPAPRLSWIVSSDRRRERQSAYQVLVASSAELLTAEQGDLWDSGKVTSDRTAQIVYAGKPLVSRMLCYWKVRIWDRNGQASSWSPAAFWGMGLLGKTDWQAQWIGSEEGRVAPPRGGRPHCPRPVTCEKSFVWTARCAAPRFTLPLWVSTNCG